jgi:predicted small lipoprotein YifL
MRARMAECLRRISRRQGGQWSTLLVSPIPSPVLSLSPVAPKGPLRAPPTATSAAVDHGPPHPLPRRNVSATATHRAEAGAHVV